MPKPHADGQQVQRVISFEGWCIARMTSRHRSPMRHPPPCKRGRHRSIYYIIIAPGREASHGERVHILRLAANEKDLLFLRMPIQKSLPQGGARPAARESSHTLHSGKRNKKAHPMDELFLILVVRSERFELSRITPLPPEDSASASSATTAYKIELRESSRKKSGAAGET